MTTHQECPRDRAQFATRVMDVYWDPFYRYAYRSLGDHHAAQDVLQDAALKTFSAWCSQPELIESSSRYCWTIFRNTLRDHVVKHSREICVSDPSDDVHGTGSASPTENGVVARDVLGRALRALPERHQEIFFLRHYAGFTTAEIAQMLGLGAPTVSAYLSSAKTRLGEWFSKLD
ncbi:RNA polymerase sigma factor [Lentzea sp. NPDC055074]